MATAARAEVLEPALLAAPVVVWGLPAALSTLPHDVPVVSPLLAAGLILARSRTSRRPTSARPRPTEVIARRLAGDHA